MSAQLPGSFSHVHVSNKGLSCGDVCQAVVFRVAAASSNTGFEPAERALVCLTNDVNAPPDGHCIRDFAAANPGVRFQKVVPRRRLALDRQVWAGRDQGQAGWGGATSTPHQPANARLAPGLLPNDGECG